ncbi:hypothetical protein C185S2P_00001 [Bacteroides phage C1_85S2P]|nr:hypothetical protein C185S2P_00001 [Bacteroides phage C1_85S2P]
MILGNIFFVGIRPFQYHVRKVQKRNRPPPFYSTTKEHNIYHLSAYNLYTHLIQHQLTRH